MQEMKSLTRFRREKNIEDKEIHSDIKSVHIKVQESCGQCYRDSCGDCASSESHKICIKSKCRKEKRYQPFTASSWRKGPVCEGHVLPSEHKFLTFSKSQPTDPKKSVSEQTSGNSSRFIVKLKELKEFFKLTEDRVIQDFLKADSCKRIADKYLIAMVFAYFKRANFLLKEYTRLNFFICLYLANDMEEDEEEIKFEIFPWALGEKWKDKYVGFLKTRDLFFKRIGYKAIVSCKCCDEIMAIEPHNPVWKRERSLHHAGALRSYMKDSDDDGLPRGPKGTPRYCSECDAPDSQYDSASPSSTCWYISSRDSSQTDPSSQSSTANLNDAVYVKDTRPSSSKSENDDVWPVTEE